MDRTALGVLAPLIRTDLGLSDAQLGLLLGFAFSLCYAVCGIPIARWADRGVRRDVIAFSLFTWSIMTGLCGITRTFWQLFVVRAGVGVGEAGCLPAAQSILCDYVPLDRRPGAMAIQASGVSVGTMMGMALAGRLAESVGWRSAFVILSLPGIALAILVRRTIREPRRGQLETEKTLERVSLNRVIAELRKCKTYRLLTIYAVASGFVQYGIAQWLPSYYVREYGLNVSLVGLFLAIASVGGVVGLLIGGIVANRLARRDAGLPLRLGAATLTIAVPTAVGAILVNSTYESVLLVGLTNMFWSISNGPVIAALYSATRPQLRATAGAINILLTAVLGFGLGPFCVGFLSQELAHSVGLQSLRYAILAPNILVSVMVIVLLAASKTLLSDVRRVSAEATITGCLR